MHLSHPHNLLMTDVLVVMAHPNPQSFSAALANAYGSGAAVFARVDTLSIHDLRFDPILHTGFGGDQPLEPDLLRAREQIEQARHVAWFFPTWWAAPPALLKGFVDRVFLPGWAFSYEGGPNPTGLLKGRSSRMVTSMDSPGLWYRLWHRRSVHASFINATLRFVGFGPVRQTTHFSLRSKSAEQRTDILMATRVLGEKDAQRFARSPSRMLPA